MLPVVASYCTAALGSSREDPLPAVNVTGQSLPCSSFSVLRISTCCTSSVLLVPWCSVCSMFRVSYSMSKT
jgi:hypothetical protein